MNKLSTIYPLSPMQQGMLLHSLLVPGSGLYTQQLVCTFHERLQVGSFRRAWEELVKRHDVLRTSFCLEDEGEPVQRVHMNVTVSFEFEDWRKVSKEEQASRLEIFLQYVWEVIWHWVTLTIQS